MLFWVYFRTTALQLTTPAMEGFLSRVCGPFYKCSIFPKEAASSLHQPITFKAQENEHIKHAPALIRSALTCIRVSLFQSYTPAF